MNLLCALLACLTMSVSAYTDTGYTASGQWTRHGIVACGPSYPFGTTFVIKQKVYVCFDRGGLITDNHLDIWMSNEDAAWKWGRQQLGVAVLERKWMNQNGKNFPLRKLVEAIN